MHTGQNSIAPENSLPQLGQVRWGSALMLLIAFQSLAIEECLSNKGVPMAIGNLSAEQTANPPERSRYPPRNRCLERVRLRPIALGCLLRCVDLCAQSF